MGGGGLVWRSWDTPPHPSGLVCLPDFIEQLHNLIVDDEHDGHIQADSAQSGNSALVESEESTGSEVSKGGRKEGAGRAGGGGQPAAKGQKAWNGDSSSV